MAERESGTKARSTAKAPKADTSKASKATAATAAKKASSAFSAEERAAMREAVQEWKREAKATSARGARSAKPDGEADLLAKIAEMPEPDRTMATRLHDIIKTVAPGLTPKTWYGMPAWAQDGSVLCFFQTSQKFKTRYATLGFSDKANLDEGNMWPTVFALAGMSAADEAWVAELLKRAVS